MVDIVKHQLENLEKALSAHQAAVGEELVREIIPAVEDFAVWIANFRSVADSDIAQDLLRGAQAAALEVISYTFLGLGRAAITAIRLQIDMILGYSYFKDHPIEWEKVKQSGDGFMLFSAIQAYHREIDRNLGQRLTSIEQRSPYTLNKLYRILSAHVHGQSPFTLPNLGPLESTVLSVGLMETTVEMQKQTTDALTCYLVAVYAKQWPQLPKQFVTHVSRLLTPRQRPIFFADYP